MITTDTGRSLLNAILVKLGYEAARKLTEE